MLKQACLFLLILYDHILERQDRGFVFLVHAYFTIFVLRSPLHYNIGARRIVSHRHYGKLWLR